MLPPLRPWLIRLLAGLLLCLGASVQGAESPRKLRILVVSSYHREYTWSQLTNQGLLRAFLERGWLDSQAQADAYARQDLVESKRLVLKKVWMDTKHRYSEQDLINSTRRVLQETKAFAPDLLMLGDDNATRYIGEQFIDTSLPVVFWGVNGMPLKYGLINSLQKPGHNITGVYQVGYFRESLELLKKLVPSAQTFAILSDNSETGRTKAKSIALLAGEGKLPLRLKATITTNSFSDWKRQAAAQQEEVDAFFVLNHNTLKDDQGKSVDPWEASQWYLKHIRKPEATDEVQHVEEGLLACADDSGFKQGYEAAQIAWQILETGKHPSGIAVYTPTRGALMVNQPRAQSLGLMMPLKSIVPEAQLVLSSRASAKRIPVAR